MGESFSLPQFHMFRHKVYQSKGRATKHHPIKTKLDKINTAIKSIPSEFAADNTPHKSEVNLYWKSKLKGWMGANDLNTLLTHPINLDVDHELLKPAQQKINISNQALQQIKVLALQEKLILSGIIQFAWHKLIQVYTGDRQTTVGALVAGKNPDLFLNILPLIISWEEQSCKNLLQSLHQELTELNTNSSIDLAKLNKNRKPLFHSIYSFEKYQKNKIKSSIVNTIEKMNYVICLRAVENKHGLDLILRYDEKYLTSVQANRILQQTVTILSQIPEKYTQPHHQLTLLNQKEYHKIIHTWNRTDKPYPREKTLSDLFELQVMRTPHKYAISFQDEYLTYQQLNIKANQFAHYLKYQYKELLKPDSLIIICGEKSITVIIAMLAIMKLGCAFVPIDPAYPKERIHFIINDTHAKLILTQKKLIKKLKFTEIKHEDLNLLTFDNIDFSQQKSENLAIEKDPLSLAYVIYTSGSTGTPKGVMTPQQSIVNTITAEIDALNINEKSNILQFASFSFDAAVWEIYGALLSGAQLTLSPAENILPGDALLNTVKTKGISIATIAPTALSITPVDTQLPLELLVVAGEACSVSLMQRWAKHVKFINAYGPTEASICASMSICDYQSNNINMGKALPNVKLYVLDEYLRPVPVGVKGELYIGGAGLARGYLNQPELTQSKFIPNPFASASDINNGFTRLYASGDLVKWLPDGNLEFIGRKDFQVKIRGYRIELGEIETVLAQYPTVKHNVVVMKERDSTEATRYLAAYYVATKPIAAESLRKYLASRLPEYMIPNFFIYQTALPVTHNGKIDTRALPDPELRSDLQNEKRPHNELEKTLADIWKALLRIDNISVQDDFFTIGGDSILNIQLVSKLRQLNISCKIKDIFDYRTIEQYAKHIAATSVVKNISSHCPHPVSKNAKLMYDKEKFASIASEADLCDIKIKHNAADYYQPFPMTEIQKAYLIGRLSGFEIGNVANHAYYEFGFTELDCGKLERALNTIIKTVAEMRTVFDPNQLTQRYLPYDENTHYKIKLANYTKTGKEQEIKRKRTLLIHKLYDVSQYPLFDVEVSQFENYYVLHINIDLILLDAESRALFFKRLTELYADPNFKLDKSEINFRDYRCYFELLKSSQWYQTDKTYWLEEIKHLPLRPTMPLKCNPQTITKPKFEVHHATVEGIVWEKFKEQCKDNSVSVSAALLALYGLVIVNWSEAQASLITLTIFNRYQIHPDVNKIWGDFTTTSLFGFRRTGTNLNSLIKSVHATLWNHLEHTLYEGIEAQRELAKLHDLNPAQAVSPIIFTQRGKTKHRDDLYFLSSAEIKADRLWSAQTSQAWIDLQAIETEIGFSSSWLYVSQLFEPDFIAELNNTYCNLIQYVALNSWENPIPELLPEIDRITIVKSNDSQQNKITTHLISDFDKHAINKPDNLAVVDQFGRYTYRDIYKKSLVLAQHLYQHGATKNTLIAVLCEKNCQQIIAVLGILKSGAAYLPLHVKWPLGRIEEVLEAGEIKNILVSDQQWHAIKNTSLTKNYKIIRLSDFENVEADPSIVLPTIQLTDIAYVIFTSGTTGKPKGVTLSHQSVMNTLAAVNQRFDVNSKDRILALSDLSFDLSVYDIFGLLSAGGAIVFPEHDKLNDPAQWISLLCNEGVTIWNSVPQLMQVLIDYFAHLDSPEPCKLRLILLSGDRIPLSLPNQIREYCPDSTMMSLGGATEGGIWSIWYEIKSVDGHWHSIPYGQAMPNQKVYILNESLEHCPAEVHGEIYLAGESLAVGYWGNLEKTQAHFINHPQLGRIYKTGDRGRRYQDGNLEILGRVDTQVKLSGYRIELEEIIYRVSQFNKIQRPLALVKKYEGRDHIILYYTASEPVFEESINNYLAHYFPSYMMPSFYIQLDYFPLSANGKIDYAALPQPKTKKKNNHRAPRNEIEVKLCRIWQDLLLRNQIGMDDDFFRIGGDSIFAIQLLARIRKVGLQCSIKDIFECRTIASLAQKVILSQPTKIKAEQGQLRGSGFLLPIQRWFFEQNFIKPSHWNQSFFISVPKLNLKKLKACIKMLAQHHDVLNSTFNTNNETGEIQQIYHAKLLIPELKFLDASQLPIQQCQKIFTEWQSNFNIAQGPLWQIGYIKDFPESGKAVLYFAFQHLIIDTVSWRILIDDLQSLYRGHSLGDKTSSYREWTETVKSYAFENKQLQQIARWQVQIEGQPNYSLLINSELKTRQHAQTILSVPQTQQLLQQANQAYHTEIIHLLLTAVAYALKTWHHDDVSYLTVEGHGREPIDDNIDVSRTVGWFTIMYPVKLMLKAEISDSIKTIKESLRKIRNNGIGYGAFKYYKNSEVLKKHSLPPISFNYLGQFDKQQKYWNLIDESSGISVSDENKDWNIINIYGMVLNGQLKFHIYTHLDAAATANLANALQTALQQIIDHCQKKINNNETEFTPSDFKNTYEPITIINADASGPPVIFLPPGGGGSEYFFNTVCPKIDKNLKIILIDNYLLKKGKANEFGSFRELAAFYIHILQENHILQDLPNKQCCIAGISIGADVAYEMMTQLSQMGIEVLDSFLIDPIVPLLLDKDYSAYELFPWYYDFMPQKTDNKITLFRCTQADEAFPFAQAMLDTPFLGFQKVATNLSEHLLSCAHMSIFDDQEVLTNIGSVINKSMHTMQTNMRK